MITNFNHVFLSLILALTFSSCVEIVGPEDSQKPETGVPTEDGEIITEGHVNLGLSVEWAACNLGTTLCYELGNEYNWGDYDCDLVNICGSSYDQATNELGKDWQLPSKEQMEELMEKCRWTWSQYKGWPGVIVTGPSKKAIFIPASSSNSDVRYWTGILKSKYRPYYMRINYWEETKSLYLADSYYTVCNIRPVYVGY